MEKQYQFIKTFTDEEKNKLIKLGFQLISEDRNVATFLNSPTLTFDHNKIKVAYSNNLTF